MNISENWGLSTHINLYDCNKVKIKSKEQIEIFVRALCKHLKVKAWGDTIIVHFGDNEKIAGYSLVQLIETSCITGHFVDSDLSAYIDIFSCKHYDAVEAIKFTQNFFEAKEVNYNILERK